MAAAARTSLPRDAPVRMCTAGHSSVTRPLTSRLMAERQGEVPGWLRTVQVFEYLGLAVGALLVITGVAPGLGLGVAVVSLVVAVLVQARISSYE
jgi:hypothetical protein